MAHTYTKFLCPDKKCRGEAVAEVDWVPGNARVNRFEDGTFEYNGDTEMLWDGQVNSVDLFGKLLRNGELRKKALPRNTVLVSCEFGHEWYTTKKERD